MRLGSRQISNHDPIPMSQGIAVQSRNLTGIERPSGLFDSLGTGMKVDGCRPLSWVSGYEAQGRAIGGIKASVPAGHFPQRSNFGRGDHLLKLSRGGKRRKRELGFSARRAA